LVGAEGMEPSAFAVCGQTSCQRATRLYRAPKRGSASSEAPRSIACIVRMESRFVRYVSGVSAADAASRRAFLSNIHYPRASQLKEGLMFLRLRDRMPGVRSQVLIF
jgi:hypothetical protein